MDEHWSEADLNICVLLLKTFLSVVLHTALLFCLMVMTLCRAICFSLYHGPESTKTSVCRKCPNFLCRSAAVDDFVPLFQARYPQNSLSLVRIIQHALNWELKLVTQHEVRGDRARGQAAAAVSPGPLLR